MIIDIHTHTFPDKIASKVLSKLSGTGGLMPYTDGTVTGLLNSMKQQGIDYSVIVPIVTNPSQLNTINNTAIEINEKYADKGIISFGSLHPDNEDYNSIIKSLAANGIKGIKLHPVFQGVAFDDIRFMRIISSACEHNLPILVHGGYDVSFPGVALVTPKEIRNVVEQVRPTNMIMAHMGAWGFWDEMIELLKEHKVMMDTSFSLTLPRISYEDDEELAHLNNIVPDSNHLVINGKKTVQVNLDKLDNEKFVKMVRLAGAQNVFYGSDSPWNLQDESANLVRESGLTQQECDMILGENAAKLLGLM